MNKSNYLHIAALIFSIGVLFSGCAKNDKDNMQNGVEEKLTTNLTVLHDAAIVYIEEFQQSGDSIAALDSMRTWLANHTEVKEGWFHNREFLEIEFNNGLKSPINIIPVSNGEHLSRGGGGAHSLNAFRFGEQSQEIKNKKVLVLIPYPDEFHYLSSDIQDLEASFQAGDLEMEVDIEVGANVELSDLDRLGDYGFIIFNVHGVKYGLFLKYIDEEYDITDIWFPEEVIDATFNVHSIPPDKITNGQIEIGLHIFNSSEGEVTFRFSVLITEDYIRQLNVDLSDAVVFGNHCYSGHTADGLTENNLPQAWKSKGVATYYGYAKENGKSIPVDNDFCKDMEQLLINGLVVDGDTTGEAHLKPDGSSPFYDTEKGYFESRAALMMRVEPQPPGPPLYLIQYFDMDYAYEACSADLEDSRDGQVYKTVCIGDQVWMAENLNYTGAGVCFNNNPSYCENEGRLYSIFELINRQVSTDSTTVRGLCPQGWHVPSEEEFNELIAYCGGEHNAVIKLRAEDWPIGPTPTNEFGFNLKPGQPAFYAPNTQSIEFNPTSAQAQLWASSGTIRSTGDDSYNIFETRSTYTMRVIGTSQSPGAEYYCHCRCVKD